MNKKPGLLLAICLFALIILGTSFNMNFGGNPPVSLPKGVNPDTVLYVCPAMGGTWASVATSLQPLEHYVFLGFAFVVIILAFCWGWALYQNLLKDKFSADVYKNPWAFTKIAFWVAVGFTILFVTPNHFRRVEVRGHGSDWVLCENTSSGAKAIKSGAVSAR